MRKALLLLAAALALAAPAAGAKAPLQVRMHDPGCHWFYVGGKYTKSYTARGSVTLINFDEAALVYRGPGGFKAREAVGKTIKLTRKGVYTIKMVGQAPDDNTLRLTLK